MRDTATVRRGLPPGRPAVAVHASESRPKGGTAHATTHGSGAASSSGGNVRWATAAGAFLGALGGSWLDLVHPAGGTWVFGLSLVGGAIGTVISPADAGRDGKDHGHAMSAMACATVGGLAGALLASALYYAAPPQAGHGAHVLAPSASGMGGSLSAQWAALNMYLMNGAMGGMIGGSLPDCPVLQPVRRLLAPLVRAHA